MQYRRQESGLFVFVQSFIHVFGMPHVQGAIIADEHVNPEVHMLVTEPFAFAQGNAR